MGRYDKHFYDNIRTGIQQSAAALVPILMKELAIGSGARVIDVGCGEGWWAAEFANHGCEVIGLDGPYHPEPPLGERFLPHDLAHPLPGHLAGRFDVVVCLEVAEHLQPKRAASFITELCALAPLVVFSAAIPGQGGTAHFNEQWPAYWCDLFFENGFRLNGDFRFRPWIWNNELIENWYRQNLIIAWDPDQIADPLPPTFSSIPVVHPVLWGAYR